MISRKACPECGGDLGRQAIKCRCGWKASSELPKLTVPCAYSTCPSRAILRERVKTGWANLCERHWVEEAMKKAEERNNARGLHTKQQRMDSCRKLLGVLRIPVERAEREPGQDDEVSF
jgi:hypothetical protein